MWRERLERRHIVAGGLRRVAAARSVDHGRASSDMGAGVDDVTLVAAFQRRERNVARLLAEFRHWNYFAMPACAPALRRRMCRIILRSARGPPAFTGIATDASGPDCRQRLFLNSTTRSFHHARHRKPFANIDEYNQYVQITGGVNFFCFSSHDSEKFWRYLDCLRHFSHRSRQDCA
jgi:hypothetical protein